MRDIDRVYEEADGPAVHLLKVSGRDDIFVTIGHLQATELEAETLRGDVLATFLGRGQDLDSTTSLLLQEGVVLDATGLAAVPAH